jgi:phenylacetate-CoA ligase
MAHDPIAVYQTAISRVPGYRKFLTEALGRVPEVRTPEDFRKLPFTCKKDYLVKYPLEEICLDGTLRGKHMICRSSGTTQKPFYWPQMPEQERETPQWFYAGLDEAVGISEKRTLVVVALALGSWISGELSTWALRSVALDKKDMTLITPGLNVEEVVVILERFSAQYEQTLILSYPPFAKTIVDRALAQGLPVKSYNLRFRMVGEGYSEHFRAYMAERLGTAERDVSAIWAGYASTDLGRIGTETPLSIMARRLVFRKGLAKEVYGKDETPSLCQFNPDKIYLEEVDGELVGTKHQAVPLVRYRTSDRGTLLSYDAMMGRLAGAGLDPVKALTDLGFDPSKIRKLPFLMVFGRHDGSVSFYGSKILAGQVQDVLEGTPELAKLFTGNYQLKKSEDQDLDPVLELVLEKRIGVASVEEGLAVSAFVRELSKRSTEYATIVGQRGDKARPKLTLVENGFFSGNVKIRYVA